MLKFGVILVLLINGLVGLPASQSAIGKNEVEERIVNGQEADIKDFPYIVSVHAKRPAKVQLCSGTIIAPTWVLSAAHCTQTEDVGNLFVRAGTAKENIGGRIHYVSEVINHPEYNSASSLANDISVIKVVKSFSYTTWVQPISLAPAGSPLAAGTILKVAGWGTSELGGDTSPVLVSADVPAVSQRVCAQSYGSLVTDTMLCAGHRSGGQGACQGDSGGPLVNGNVQVGILSWGAGCAEPNYPSVSTRVSAFRDWILQNAGV